MMLETVRKYIDTLQFDQESLRMLAGYLPIEDSDLNEWISEMVRFSDHKGFLFFVVCALANKRVVNANHLEMGTSLFRTSTQLAVVAWNTKGDVAKHLVAAIEKTQLLGEVQAAALFVASSWCVEHMDGNFEPGLLTQARLLARSKNHSITTEAFLRATAHILGDASLDAVMKPRIEMRKGGEVSGLVEDLQKILQSDPLDLAPVKSEKLLARGTTMRRAVERFGRNDPCPCGSGRKYKRCCLEVDNERLRHSTDVAGKTEAEIFAEPEPYLTEAKLDRTLPDELVRFDPLKIAPELIGSFVFRLAAFSLHDQVVNVFEKLGDFKDMEIIWEIAAHAATKDTRRDIVERLMRIRSEYGVSWLEFDAPSTRILLASDDHSRLLSELDLISKEVLALENTSEEDSAKLLDLAQGMLKSPHPAIGILVARGVIPIIQKRYAAFLLEELLKARDKMNFSPDDPIRDVLDRILTTEIASDQGKDTESLQDARKRFETKAVEVRQLKEKLGQLHREMKIRENPHPDPIVGVSSHPPSDAAASSLRDLRDRITTLKSKLKERHEERAVLREELQKAHADIENLRISAVTTAIAPQEGNAAEDELFLPHKDESDQPVRLIEFPKKFSATLAVLPKHNARATMALIGHLAAGDPTAFSGVVQLKTCTSILRQRVGSDYRLLFRLYPDRVEVIDLINRRDLERRIKTLV